MDRVPNDSSTHPYSKTIPKNQSGRSRLTFALFEVKRIQKASNIDRSSPECLDHWRLCLAEAGVMKNDFQNLNSTYLITCWVPLVLLLCVASRNLCKRCFHPVRASNSSNRHDARNTMTGVGARKNGLAASARHNTEAFPNSKTIKDPFDL